MTGYQGMTGDPNTDGLEPGYYWVVFDTLPDEGVQMARYDVEMGLGLRPTPRWTLMDELAYYRTDEDFGKTIRPISDRLIPPTQAPRSGRDGALDG